MRIKLFKEYSSYGDKESYYKIQSVYDFTGVHPFDESDKREISRIFGKDKWVLSYSDDNKWVMIWEISANIPKVLIRPLPDEYYDVKIYGYGTPQYYRCDQFDGVKELLKDYNIYEN
jgi:hypothetical protein